MFEFFKKNQKVIHVNDIDFLEKPYNLIDIREPFEYRSGAINNSINIPMGNLLSNPEKYLKKETSYLIMCQSGGRSGQTVKNLLKLGYNVTNVTGGMGAYVGTNRK